MRTKCYFKFLLLALSGFVLVSCSSFSYPGKKIYYGDPTSFNVEYYRVIPEKLAKKITSTLISKFETPYGPEADTSWKQPSLIYHTMECYYDPKLEKYKFRFMIGSFRERYTRIYPDATHRYPVYDYREVEKWREMYSPSKVEAELFVAARRRLIKK